MVITSLIFAGLRKELISHLFMIECFTLYHIWSYIFFFQTWPVSVHPLLACTGSDEKSIAIWILIPSKGIGHLSHAHFGIFLLCFTFEHVTVACHGEALSLDHVCFGLCALLYLHVYVFLQIGEIVCYYFTDKVF